MSSVPSTVSPSLTGLALELPSTLATVEAGQKYSYDCHASGGCPPYTFSYQGEMPPGLELSAEGTISGKPKERAVGRDWVFDILVRDSSDPPEKISGRTSITVVS
jgi:Putative Ig domain